MSSSDTISTSCLNHQIFKYDQQAISEPIKHILVMLRHATSLPVRTCSSRLVVLPRLSVNFHTNLKLSQGESTDTKSAILERLRKDREDHPRTDERQKVSRTQAVHVSHSKMVSYEGAVWEYIEHYVKPSEYDEYMDIVGDYVPGLYPQESRSKLLGAFTSATGDLDRVIYLIQHDGAYKTLDHHLQVTTKSDLYRKFRKDVMKRLNKRERTILLAFNFLPVLQSGSNGVYELRDYHVQSGKILDWEHHWRKGIDIRRELGTAVGAWFSQLGTMNHVYHMWGYPDLEKRKQLRDAMWEFETWPQVVYRTVPLIEGMQSTILEPLDFSPLK